MSDFVAFFSSAATRAVVAALGAIVVLLTVFTLGVGIGERRARQAMPFFAGYQDQFGQRRPERPFFAVLPERGLPNTHGAFGTVISRADNVLVVRGREDMEQTVLISSSTVIRAQDHDAALADLAVDTSVAVFGEPNGQGQIRAKLVRILPPIHP